MNDFKYCRNCGQTISGESFVCPHCGVLVKEEQKQTKSNVMAILGFIFSFFISLLGLIFGIIGLSKSKKEPYNGDGRGLSIAAIIISCISMIFSLFFVTAILAALASM